jgi:mRNA interferase MazF
LFAGVDEVDGGLRVLGPPAVPVHWHWTSTVRVPFFTSQVSSTTGTVGLGEEVPDDVFARVVADGLGVSGGPAQQVPHAEWGGLPGPLRDRPAALARQIRQRAQHQALGPEAGFDPREPPGCPAHQANERLLPAGRVYAVTCGHRAYACRPVSGGHVQRGEVWWVEFDERRPVVLLSEGDASGIRVMQVVAPAGVDISGLGVEVAVGAMEGLPFEGVLRFAFPSPGFTPCTWLTTVSRGDLTERAGVLPHAKLNEIEDAVRLAGQTRERTPATTAKLSALRGHLIWLTR